MAQSRKRQINFRRLFQPLTTSFGLTDSFAACEVDEVYFALNNRTLPDPIKPQLKQRMAPAAHGIHRGGGGGALFGALDDDFFKLLN